MPSVTQRRWGSVTRKFNVKLAGHSFWPVTKYLLLQLPAWAVVILVTIVTAAGPFLVVTLTGLSVKTTAVQFWKVFTTSRCNAKMILTCTYLKASRAVTLLAGTLQVLAATPVVVARTPVVVQQQLPSPTSQGYSCYWLLLPTSSCSEDCRCKPGFPQL